MDGNLKTGILADVRLVVAEEYQLLGGVGSRESDQVESDLSLEHVLSSPPDDVLSLHVSS